MNDCYECGATTNLVLGKKSVNKQGIVREYFSCRSCHATRQRKWRATPAGRESSRKSVKKYRETHRTYYYRERKEYHKKYYSKRFYGGNRDIVLERDNYQCVHCGMTREEHKLKYGRDITVDHINGKGTRVAKHLQDNDLNNLQTLCLSCHIKKDTLKQHK